MCPFYLNSAEVINALMLPKDDPNLIISVHCYELGNFTLQGVYNSDIEEVSLEGILNSFELAKAYYNHRGLEIWYSEFGVMETVDLNDRVTYIDYFTDICEEYGFGWCYWNVDCSPFTVYDYANDTWFDGVLEALMD